MRVTTLTPQRIAEACTVLGEAFADEPVSTRMIPGDRSERMKRLATYFRWSIRYTGCENVDVVIDPRTDKVVGAALWEPPAHRPHKLRAAMAFPAVFFALGRHGMRVLKEFEAISAGAHPAGPLWYLVDIGVSAAARGTGAGSALLKHRLGIIDARGEVVSLEATTDRSAALYERWGFVRGNALTGVAEGSVVMTRQPQPIA